MTHGLGGLILAAGDSRRMGSPKALLDLGGKAFLQIGMELARSAGLDPIRIVVGNHGDEIAAALPEFSDKMIRNDQPELGQLRSLQLGLERMPDEIGGVMVFLVDHPCVKASTVSALIDAFDKGAGRIVLPSCDGRRGHPVIFGREVFEDLKAAPLDQGARAVVRGQPELVATVEVDDAGILKDIDTPQQYREVGSDEQG